MSLKLEFLGQLSNCQIFKQDLAPWSSPDLNNFASVSAQMEVSQGYLMLDFSIPLPFVLSF